MKHWIRKTKNVLVKSVLLFFSLTITLSSFPGIAFANTGNETIAGLWKAAGQCMGSGFAVYPGTATGCPQEGAAAAAEFEKKESLDPTIGASFAMVLINVASFVANRLAFETAVWIASGATGQEPLYEDTLASEGFLKKFGKDVAGEAIGQLSKNVLNDHLGIELDLCRPPGDLLTLALQLGIKQAYQPQKPVCDFDTVIEGWSEFASNVYAGGQAAFGTTEEGRKARNKFLLKKAAESLKPGQNALDATVRINIRVHDAVQNQRYAKFMEPAVQGNFKSVKDAVTGKITTPDEMVQTEVNRKLQSEFHSDRLTAADLLGSTSDVWSTLGMSAVNTFTNTLLSETLSGIYRGLFDPKPEGDLFDPELVSVNGNNKAKQQFAGLLTTTPIQITEYNALSEFVVCPASDVMNRGLYNCVFDANFLTAVSRGNSVAPLTVQEAINEGLLDGGRPLISPEDKVSNNDPNCYTYGYCYGNLVKLRKARIVSVGWELAARANSATNPKTLQEIVDQFDNCNAQGTIDSDHKFCHLIDPNWILKYPPTQCRAVVNGEIRVSALSNGRNNVCVDSPSCLGQGPNGECEKGYGYCVEEKNVWRFRGDSCPEHYASCLSLENTTDKSKTAVLLQTVDFSVCNQSNAGCRWYRTNKYQDVHDRENPNDNTFEWMPTGETYLTGARDNDLKYQLAGTNSDREPYFYDSAPDPARGYSIYSYEDRIYFNNDVKTCQSDQAGCTALNSAKDTTLNVVRNGSFERDENGDRFPDDWIVENNGEFYISATSRAAQGGNIVVLSGNFRGATQLVPVKENEFYTASFSVRGTGAIGPGYAVNLTALDENGAELNLGGLSYGGDCSIQANHYRLTGALVTDEWKRVRCTFTTPRNTVSVKVAVMNEGNPVGVGIDALQLQVGEVATDFSDGYSVTPQTTYLTVAPDYLNCQGRATDHKDCANYVGQCQAQDVGCNLYNPADGDPSVPAIVSAIDMCPDECIGYASYRQERTTYDIPQDPYQSFIPEKAKACSEENVGCDAFTNVEASAQGGEKREYYSMLRRCVTPAGTDPNDEAKKSATFFTWEGSDNSGYQLRSWQLLESEWVANQQLAYVNPNVDRDSFAGQAPCTHSTVQAVGGTSVLEVVCKDGSDNHAGQLAFDESCNDHTDIFANPDCREFFDTSGNVHYRKFSETVTVSDECKAYRKDVSEEGSCLATGGAWQEAQGTCRYFGLQSESKSCPAEQNGCRAYTGNASRNVAKILDEDFESGNYDHFSVINGNVTISNESLAAAGHSLRILKNNGVSASVRTVDDQLEDVVSGRSLFLSFWAKGDTTLQVLVGGTNEVIEPFFDTPDAEGAFIQGVPLSGSWKLYQFDALTMPAFDATDHPHLIFRTTNPGTVTYVDNIVLKMTSSKINIIKDSWVVPASCDTNPNGTIVPGYYLGCEAYTDQRGANASLYQFTNLCSEKTVGCAQFYNTHNSDSPYGQVNNARCVLGGGVPAVNPTACKIGGKTYCTIQRDQQFCTFDSKELVPDLLPREGNFSVVFGPETVVVQADSPVYLIDDGSHSCQPQFAGCQEVGVPTFNQTGLQVTKFDSKFIINDPDQYESQLCNDEALFCDEFKHKSEGNFYFKDPIKKTCEYKAAVQLSDQNGVNHEISGWFRSGTQEPCYWTDVRPVGDRGPLNGIFEFGFDRAYLISGDSAGIWYNGDQAWDGWVGTCEESYDMCTEFVDIPDTSGGKNPDGQRYFYINNDKLKDSNVSVGTKCEGRVSQKEGCAIFNNKTESQLSYNASASYVLSAHADLLLSQEANTLVDPVDCDLNGGAEGAFNVSVSAAETINRTSSGRITVVNTTNPVNICSRRCVYGLPDTSNTLQTQMASENMLCAGADCPGLFGFGSNIQAYTFERSCLIDTDCPVQITNQGEEVRGICSETANLLRNDSNNILKVNRDRECSAWLSCKSSRNSWNTQTNSYINICDSIEMCRKGKLKGETPLCIEPDEREAKILNAYEYSSRDVNWNGFDLSGYAIPNQLPVERYDQVDVGLEGTCSDIATPDGRKYSCQSHADCGVETCEPNANYKVDYRLVYDAGTCKSTVGAGSVGFGGNCQTGVCQKSGNSCISDSECDEDSGEPCVIGYCQATATTGGRDNNGKCVTNADCTTAGNPAKAGGVNTPICENGQCVDTLLSSKQDPCVASADCGANKTCVTASTTSNGSCINNHCITAISDSNNDSFADKIQVTDSGVASLNDVKQICRGYPEIDSPFPKSVVETWSRHNRDGDLTGEASTPTHQSDTPLRFVNGYQDATVCAPDKAGNVSDECSRTCSYKKVQYGGNFATKYYSMETNVELNANKDAGEVLSGICSSGESVGKECKLDVDCGANEDGTPAIKGSCVKITSRQDVFGWQGYCLEQDSSIILYGTPSNGTYACLTWHPVDQLAGTTDLYAKYSTAGFTPSDVEYCGEVEQVYDLYTTGFACAETQGGNCDDEYSHGAFSDDNPTFLCPDGFFAIASACGKSVVGPNCSGGDDDYPYFCVPFGSRKTEENLNVVFNGNDNTRPGFVGEICTPPTENERDFIYNPNGRGGWAGSVTYVPGGPGRYDNWREYYNDCAVKGLTKEDLRDVYLRMGSPSPEGRTLSTLQNSINGRGDGDVFEDNLVRSFDFTYMTYPACSNLIKVSNQSFFDPDEGRYNVAYTNKMWLGSKNKISEVGAFSGQLAYQFGTADSPYGKSIGLDVLSDQIDSIPPRVAMCETGGQWGFNPMVMQTITGEGTAQCDAGSDYLHETSSIEFNQLIDSNGEKVSAINGGYARSYYQFSFGADLEAPVAGLCRGGDCNACRSDDDCNFASLVDGDVVTPICEYSEWRCDNVTHNGEIDEEEDENDNACHGSGGCDGGEHLLCNNQRQCECRTDNDCSGDNICTNNVCVRGNADTNNDGEIDSAKQCESNLDCAFKTLCLPKTDSPKQCEGGAVDGNNCDGDGANNDSSACEPNTCIGYAAASRDSDGNAIAERLGSCKLKIDESDAIQLGPGENVLLAKNRLKQIFAKSYEIINFESEVDSNDEGLLWRNPRLDNRDAARGMVPDSNDDSSGAFQEPLPIQPGEEWYWDDRAKNGYSPNIWALSNCQNDKCEESSHDEGDAFTVSGPGGDQNGGVVEGVGSQTIDVKFYVQANSDQMPVRRIVVDWGDDLSSPLEWGTGSQTPPDAMRQGGNFYMNHRGMLDISDGKEYCGSRGDDFGLSDDACSESYVSMNHDYVCSARHLSTLQNKICRTDPDTGKLLNSPCTGGNIGIESEGACVFQPRVHVMDNWGWCTGVCPGGVDDSDGCFDGDGLEPNGQNECNVARCPGEACRAGDESNPWINFGGGNGYIVIRPE